MEIKRYDAGPRMSRVVEYGGVLYFGGHVATAEHVDITAQMKALTKRFDDLFGQFGTDKDHMIFATIYIKDVSLIEEMNTAWDQWINAGKAPARACVQAKMAEERILLEIAIIAAKKE